MRGAFARPNKVSYVGAPAIWELELACQELHAAFDSDDGPCGIYLVGSALERPDWRDVDVRYILCDKAFDTLFPNASTINGAWEFDPRFLVMCSSISAWLTKRTGLPIDFQFQPQTHANARHKKHRHSLGMRTSKREDPKPKSHYDE